MRLPFPGAGWSRFQSQKKQNTTKEEWWVLVEVTTLLSRKDAKLAAINWDNCQLPSLFKRLYIKRDYIATKKSILTQFLIGGLTIGSSHTTYTRRKIYLQSAVGRARELMLRLENLIWFKSCAECIARRLIVSLSPPCRFAALDIPIFLLMPTIKRLPVRAAHLPMCHDGTFPLS